MKIPNNTKERPKPEMVGSRNPNDANFSFDSWASAVRDQMLAVLQKNSSADQPE